MLTEIISLQIKRKQEQDTHFKDKDNPNPSRYSHTMWHEGCIIGYSV